MEQPNIIFIVWDACRYDFAVEHAPFLSHLASSNIWFDNAIAPSPWSLPSHASMFTGELPHEHGRYRFGDRINTPLVSKLSEHGYRTYGVSANGFASQRTGFHADFDEFRYTGGRDRYVDGLDASGQAQRILNDEGGTFGDALSAIVQKIPRHDYPIKSLINFAAVGLGEVATTNNFLHRIPHSVFAPTSDYSYDPERNTNVIHSFLQSHDSNEPFFLFTNYMDTHRCYKPDPALQKKHLGRTLDYGELVRLNEELAAPLEFEMRKVNGEINEGDIDTLQGLYAGEVETTDRHLKRIYSLLDEEGLLENTIIVVTADHGENLGDINEMGRKRFGHQGSISDAVLRVPLAVIAPGVDGVTIENEISLEKLYDFFTSIRDFATLSEAIQDIIPGSAVSQYPARGGGDGAIKKYPSVPETITRYSSSEHSVAVYRDDWRIVFESTGDQWAFKDGEPVNSSNVPESLTTLAETQLEALSKRSVDELSTDQASQLENLGYL